MAQDDAAPPSVATARRVGAVLALACAGAAAVSLALQAPQRIGSLQQHALVQLDSTAPVGPTRVASTAPVGDEGPTWGCGLVGHLPGITQNGTASAQTKRLIDGIKSSSSLGKVSYWNWNLAPQSTEDGEEHLTSDFLFMPEQWGAGVVNDQYVRVANKANFLDSNGKACPATMADVFLGMNEPDISGSCMGNMFGSCTKSCSEASVAAGDCPAAVLGSDQPAHANSKGECNCWQFSHATGVGFWPVQGCAGQQPLMTLFEDPVCTDVVMSSWKQTAAIAFKKGYKYLSTPLVAANMQYATDFIEHACKECQEISCGCPQYVAFHFYAYDCQPVSTGGYKTFRDRINHVKGLMEKHSFIKGAIINEVGMLNCAGEMDNPICIPNNGKYPASGEANHQCPKNKELPNGLSTFVEELLDIVAKAKTSDGRAVVKAFSWFNLNMAGGTYNLRLFDDTGKLNEVGESYIRGCSKWGTALGQQQTTA